MTTFDFAVLAAGTQRVDSVLHLDAIEAAPPGAVLLDAFNGFPPCPEGCEIRVVDGALMAVDLRGIDDIKAAKWGAIKAQRQALDEQPMALRDFSVDADLQSRQDVMGAVMSMQLTGQTERLWRCSDNVMRTLTFADLVAIGTGIAARRQQLIETSDALYQQIQAAESISAVAAIGWPS